MPTEDEPGGALANLLHDSLKDNKTRVIGIDPGETTGVCVFLGATLIQWDQLKTKEVPTGAATLCNFITCQKPDVVVMEMYRVYSWKAEDHSWHNLHTPRLIGAVEYICHILDIPLIQQTAQQAKGFCTDEKLAAWNLYQPGQKHARDSIRHAVYYLLFNVAQVQGLKLPPKAISGGTKL